MGRAGRSGGSRGGSRSSSRSGGSHRSSGSNRAGRSSSYHRVSSGSNSHSYNYRGISHIYNKVNINTGRSYDDNSSYGSYSRIDIRTTGPSSEYRRSRVTRFDKFVLLIILTVLLIAIAYGTADKTKTSEREPRVKLETSIPYDNDVVLLDETGWVESESKVGSELREFWELTGVQPYIILYDYKSNLKTDAQKEEFTIDYYDNNIKQENAFLFVYFGEKDLEGDVGLMCYALGKQTGKLMDDIAIDTFFDEMDYYWYSDYDTTDVFVKAFNNTAKSIMKEPADFTGFIKAIVLLAVAVIIVWGTVKCITILMKRQKEKAEETERILKASMGDLSGTPDVEDDLLNKYK